MTNLDKYFYPSQRNWILDDSPLKIAVKSRQIGFSYANAFRLVLLVSAKDARLDAFISSRDEFQAKLQLEDCAHWADVLHSRARNLGEAVLDSSTKSSAHVLQFANGRRIYSLSSNPNALAGKRGHITLDEFALHQDQRTLYRIAKPCTTWGGQLSIISTHRGVNTLFYHLIRDITENGNPMAWSYYCVPIHKAVEEGIVERINARTGRNDSREAFLKRLETECIDAEQWKQEYCCIPADENSAFFSYEMLDACTDPNLKIFTSLQEFLTHHASRITDSDHHSVIPTSQYSASPSLHHSSFYLGLDIARRNNLCVIDVGEKIGSVTYDRLRIELQNKTFTEIEDTIYPILRLPQLKRACIDNSGIGAQFAEQARDNFGWKVEPVTFTPARKEEMAFALRRDFEDGNLRIPKDDALRADLRALQKEVTPSGKLRFIGEVENSHCDRTWAKALRQHASRVRASAGAMLIY